MKMKKRNGVTLVELLMALLCLSAVFLIAATLLGLGTNFFGLSKDEFNLHTNMREASDLITNKVRYSSAVFVIPEKTFNKAKIDAGILTEGWDYFGIVETDSGQYEIVNYVYNAETDQHDKKVIVEAQTDFTYMLEFIKNSDSNNNPLVEYKLIAYKNENEEYQRELNSEMASLNALQVIDWTTELDKGRAIAYRSDDRETITIGRVVMVLDCSGSMGWDMDGWRGYVNRYTGEKIYTSSTTNAINRGVPVAEQRITIMKTAAKDIIKSFSEEEGISVSMVRFSTNANIGNLTTLYPSRDYEFLDPTNSTVFTRLNTAINNLVANGGTNTGDGLRRAYHLFEKTPDDENYTVKEYVILLVDGDSTYASLDAYPGYASPANYMMGKGDLGGSNTTARYRTAAYSTTTGDYIDGRNTISSSSGRLGGTGNTPADGVIDQHSREYTILQGQRLVERGVKPYVVALSSSVSTAGINNIRTAFNLPSDSPRVFQATTGESLVQAFAEIRDAIIDDLWFINGPRQDIG